jgi:hypothetical protein
MKKLSAILFATLLVVGLGSCDKEPNDVQPQATSLTLNSTAVTLKVGDTRQLIVTVEPKDQAYTVTFASDNEKVATVDAKGLVKAVAEGTANISAKVGGLTAKCVVTVSNSAPSVTLTIKTPTLTIERGKTAQIDYTVTPADTPITFTSDKTDIATVDAHGVVAAVAAGSATITVVAAGQEAQVAVTVTEDNGGGSKIAQNELPLLMFEATADENGITNQEVLNHEAKIGRTAQSLSFWGQGPFPGAFVNKDLTIVGAVYGLVFTDSKEYVIPAFSKESLANCPKTLAMLADYGFTIFSDGMYDKDTPFKKSLNDNEPSVSVEIYDDPNNELGSTLMILFIKPMPKKDIEIAHDILPGAKDFPDYKLLATKDAAKIKEFETNLGLREYDSEESEEAKKNLFFTSKATSIAQTNFSLVCYICTPDEGTPYVNSAVNCIKNSNDFDDPKLKEWFTTNGYGNNFKANSARGYALGYDATGKVLAQIFTNSEETMAMLQIIEKPQTQSAAQLRSLAIKQYKEMKTLTKTKHRKLQQMRRR